MDQPDPATPVCLDHDDWRQAFVPVANPSGSAGDEVFETFGDEFAQVAAVAQSCPGRVWTDLGGALVNGLRLVDRVVHAITERACRPGVDVVVVDFDLLAEMADRGRCAQVRNLVPADPAQAAELDEVVAAAAAEQAWARTHQVEASSVVAP